MLDKNKDTRADINEISSKIENTFYENEEGI